MLSKLAARKKSPNNACRKFHHVAQTSGKRLPVAIDWVQTPIRTITKSKVTEELVDFPTLPLSSWMRASFDLGGHIFVGGKGMDHLNQFCDILHDWWIKYRRLDPNLPVYEDFDESDCRFLIPIAIHGDEGRGRYKRPIMIFSFQPILTNFEGQANLKGSGLVNMCTKHVVFKTCFEPVFTGYVIYIDAPC